MCCFSLQVYKRSDHLDPDPLDNVLLCPHVCAPQCVNVNPAFDIPDGVQKAAEHVVREVVKEVHGPFFNSTVRSHE
jgi:hypothetical protein